MHRAVAAVAAVLVLGFVTGTTAVASASPAGASPASTGTASTNAPFARTNESATHSPELERALAGRAALAPAAKARPATLPAGASTVQGVDVASLQHPDGKAINWADVAGAGYKFAFIKVTEGSYYANPYYAADAAGARAAGMFVAPYEFAIPNYSGGAFQTDYALDQAHYAANDRTLPLILDLEYDPYAGEDGTASGSWCYGLTTAQMVAWISASVTEAVRRTGQAPVIYTVQDWWSKCTGSSTAFGADPLWLAGSSTELPAGWSSWAEYQYTSSAKVSGIPVDTDASYLSTTALELAAPATQSGPTGTGISLQANALDGGGAVTFSATGLPTGLSIDATTGAISGTLPVEDGAFRPEITASASGDADATQTFSWDVHGAATLGSLASRTGSVASPVHYQVPAKDGLSGCTLTFAASGLPRGLSISRCGLITGWPQDSGKYTVKVHLTDSSGATLASGSFRWTLSRASGSGPVGQIRLRRDGKCLDARSTTDVAIEPCSSSSNQRWTYAANGSVRVHGECLVAKSASGSATAALALASCSTDGQRWQLSTNAVLTNLTDSRCLSDTGSANGSRAGAATCAAKSNATGSATTPSTSQQWTVPAGRLTSGLAGYCASNLAGSGDQSGAVTLRRCNNSSGQDWTVEPDGAISVTGKCLGLTNGTTVPGTLVKLVSCGNSAGQVWQLSGGPVGVQLVSPVAGLCLADPGDRESSGTQLVIDPCVAGDPGTLWRVS